MKTINLTKGYRALVDDQYFEWLSHWKWQAHEVRGRVYAIRQVYDPSAYSDGRKCRSKVYMHRAILGEIGRLFGEHRDRNGLNNQRSNLRTATNSQNGHNRGPNKNNHSGFKGVGWSNRWKKWRARLMVEGRMVLQEWFPTAKKAALAYDAAAKKHVGQFCWLNFPNAL